jgi:SAM-dependent methyltransferase
MDNLESMAWRSHAASARSFAVDQAFPDIVEACRRPRIRAQLHSALAQEREGARRLDRLCSLLIIEALRDSGLFDVNRPVLSIEAICHRMAVREARRPQIRRYLDILQADRQLRCIGDDCRWVGEISPDPSQIEAEAAAFERDFSFAAGAAGMMLRCMRALPQVLAGEESAVAVLFANGTVTELEVFYSRFPLLALANVMVASTVARIAEHRRGEPLHALEIGAGTGALTASVLPAISAQLHRYVYSDLSPSFLAHGQRKFARYAALETMIVDIDRDPMTQGLEDESFDLIVGSNVVHATPDIRRSIRHLRHSLRAGGQLVLVETVAPSRFADCTVGLLDGWWSFRDPQLRKGYPLLSMIQWQAVLREEGFRAAVVPVGYHGTSSPTSVAVLVAEKEGSHPGGLHGRGRPLRRAS